ELTVGAPEGDPLEALAVVTGGDAADMAVADDARLEQPHRAGRDARARPARAVRARGIQRVVGARFLDVRGEAVVDEGAERLEPAGGKGETGRHRVTAAGDEKAAVLCGEHRRAEVDARDRPARAL